MDQIFQCFSLKVVQKLADFINQYNFKLFYRFVYAESNGDILKSVP